MTPTFKYESPGTWPEPWNWEKGRWKEIDKISRNLGTNPSFPTILDVWLNLYFLTPTGEIRAHLESEPSPFLPP